jgi:DNA-directed RNA polymerase, mitochondrial
MSADLDKSVERLVDAEGRTAYSVGHSLTRQGQALTAKYLPVLIGLIEAEKKRRRSDWAIWPSLRSIKTDALALRLLVAGVNVAAADDLGVDRKTGDKTYLDIALWLGRHFNFNLRGEIGFKVGAWAIDLLSRLPCFEIKDGILILGAPVADFFDAAMAEAVKDHPLLTPRLEPPQPWTQFHRGALPPDHWAKVPLVLDHHRSTETAVQAAIAAGKMDKCLAAINALQAVPLAINVPVLEFMMRSGVADQSQLRDLTTAEFLACYGQFYIPLQIDFRGRLYGISHFNFAREDHVRALIQFARGAPIGASGIPWLKSHLAGTADGVSWGHNPRPGDLGFEERIAWADANVGTIRRVAGAVLNGEQRSAIEWALPPKKPFQFAAACVELVQAIDVPDFETRLPLLFDGSCSGMQHLAGMTRSEDEGAYVNLVPAPEGVDLYRRVAYEVYDSNPDLWIQFAESPFDRRVIKQPTMTFFYGSRPGGFAKDPRGKWHPYGMTKQIIDATGKKNIAAKSLAHATHGAIRRRFPRAASVLDFLEALVDACQDGVLRWTSPMGLPISNRYHRYITRRIETSLRGRRHRTKFVVGEKPDPWRSKAKDAITANFVHSVDAAHLQMIALAATDASIDMLCIHDCFGCIAPHADRFNDIIRDQFIRLHRRNHLNEVREAVRRRSVNIKLPPLPKIGDLDLELIRKSFHAFK